MINFTTAKPGDQGIVAAIKTTDATTVQRLLAMGIVPGAPISVEQAFPAYILKVGRTRVSVDRQMAEQIYIQVFIDPPRSS